MVNSEAKKNRTLPSVSTDISISFGVNKGFPYIAYQAPNFFIAKYLAKGLHRIELVLYNSPDFSLFNEGKQKIVLKPGHELGIR